MCKCIVPDSAPVSGAGCSPESLAGLTIVLRGGGDIATGVALRLHRAGLRRIVVLEQARPLAVRRRVALSEAVYDGVTTVENLTARLATDPADCPALWAQGIVPVFVDPQGALVRVLRPEVLVEATLAKRNVGVRRSDAPLVIGLGPGFVAGEDVHAVVETNRGLSLGRVLMQGSAAPNTGLPGPVQGFTWERVLRAPTSGHLNTCCDIGDCVVAGDLVGEVEGTPLRAAIGGRIRGLLRNGTYIEEGVKVGDIDPRGDIACDVVSEKALAVAGGVLEALLAWHLAPCRAEPGDTGEKA